ncbi:hypothetical protein FACS189461_1360 [Spirochaetia bacterium]|nr:hypothetical protein FACS189461_1360 [Spirochaetia bacterium]
MKEYAIGAELTPEEAKEEMQAGRVLITGDGTERAMLYKKHYVSWHISGNLGGVLMFLADFTRWHVQEREEWLRREIATTKNTGIKLLNKTMVA